MSDEIPPAPPRPRPLSTYVERGVEKSLGWQGVRQGVR
jgi:hypothetical protein